MLLNTFNGLNRQGAAYKAFHLSLHLSACLSVCLSVHQSWLMNVTLSIADIDVDKHNMVASDASIHSKSDETVFFKNTAAKMGKKRLVQAH